MKFLRKPFLIEYLQCLLQKILGEYHHLLLEQRSGEHEFYFSHLRMNPEKFDHLLSLVKDKITNENAKFRKSISAEERLELTLRIFATGMSQQSMNFAFRIGKSTVGKALAENLAAIYGKPKSTYRRAPTTPNNWLRVSKQFEGT